MLEGWRWRGFARSDPQLPSLSGESLAIRKSKSSRGKRQVSKRLTKKRRSPAPIKPKRPTVRKRTKSTRSLKSDLAKLKRLGLFKSKRDLRKVKKTDKRAKAIVAKFEDVLSGKSRVLTFKPKDAKGYKRAGYRTVGDKVIVPEQKKTKTRKRGRFIERRRKVEFGEIITLATPFSYADLQTRLDELEKDKEVQRLLRKGWRLTLRYFGNYAYSSMPTFDLLRQYLEHYNLEQDDKKVQNLELMIILTAPGFNLPEEAQRKAMARKRRKKRDQRGNTISTYSPERFQRWKRNNPEAYKSFTQLVRKNMRKYRKRLARRK